MVKRRTLGLAAFAGATLGGVALCYLAERRLVTVGPPTGDPEWEELSIPPPVEERTVEGFDGTHLHVVEAGPPSAPVVVFVHGYAMSWRFWHYQVRDLADRFRVVAYDQRGHAASEPAASGDYSTRALARDLRTVIEATAGDTPALVVGHSLGGMTVMALADEFPAFVADRLAGAVLTNTAASKVIYRGLLHGLSGAVQAMRRLPRQPPRLWPLPGRVGTADLSHLLTRQWSMTREASPALVGFVEALTAGTPVDVVGGFGRVLATLDLEAALDHLVVPTLVIVGAHDWLTPARQGHTLAEALPDARVEELADCGHMPPLEVPEAFNALVRAHATRVFGNPERGVA